MTERGRGSAEARRAVDAIVGRLIALSESEEARRLLGVDGALTDQVDVLLLQEPLDYVGYDIAAALRDAEEGVTPEPASMLTTLVAEVRLAGLVSGTLDQRALSDHVWRHLEALHE